MKKKTATAAEKRHMDAVQALGCLIHYSPAEIHHCGTYSGGGRDHMKVLPLCPRCHRGHGYGISLHDGKKRWEEINGAEEYWLGVVNGRLGL